MGDILTTIDTYVNISTTIDIGGGRMAPIEITGDAGGDDSDCCSGCGPGCC
jgi:hypothetical protein